MNNLIKKLPLPISGAMLGIFACGNLVSDFSISLKYFCGIIGIIILILILSKMIKYPKNITDELKNPVIASVFPTFLMSLIILSSYISPFQINIATALWFLSIFLFIILIIYFTIMFFIKNYDLKNVYASYYIVYIGIVIGSITSPIYHQEFIGKLILIFGGLSFIFLVILTMYRYLKLKTPEKFKPLICINAAPFSLILYGYLNVYTNISQSVVVFLFIFAIIFYIFAIIKFIEYRNLQFYPSYSAFAFPFVVAALASKETVKYLGISYLNYFVYLQILIAIFLVAYVLINYTVFLKKLY